MNTVNELIKSMHPNGAILVAMKDKIIYEKYLGYVDIANQVATSPQTQYLIGSVTKQFTAVALLKALSENDGNSLEQVKLALQKPIASYLDRDHAIWDGAMPEWANQINVHQLLVHSSGIPNYTSLPGFNNQLAVSATALVTLMKSFPLEFTPGTKFSYNNSGYYLLGIIIEQLTQQPLGSYLQDSIFQPLNMQSTYLPANGTVPDLKRDDKFKHLATGYTIDLAMLEPKLKEVDNYTVPHVAGPAGGIISTALDLWKWNTALFSGVVMPASLVELMVQPYIQSELENEYYGYGIEIKQDNKFGTYYRHPGGIPGFKSRLIFIPRDEISIVIVENVDGELTSLIPEAEIMKSQLPDTLTEQEKYQQIAVMLEDKYPVIVKNRKEYQLTLLDNSIIAALAFGS